jgi:hypothetical protein
MGGSLGAEKITFYCLKKYAHVENTKKANTLISEGPPITPPQSRHKKSEHPFAGMFA